MVLIRDFELLVPKFYDDLVYKLKRSFALIIFQRNLISHYIKIGYNINVLQQTACLVVNQITVGNFLLTVQRLYFFCGSFL